MLHLPPPKIFCGTPFTNGVSRQYKSPLLLFPSETDPSTRLCSGGRIRTTTPAMAAATASSNSGDDASCYYSRLGIRKIASATEIRAAYRKLALKWHPDRWAGNPTAAGDAKRRFQKIQEAYSVLSNDGKRAMYDAGIYDPYDDDDQDFTDFMQEMLSTMDRVRPEKPDSFEDLQRMFEELIGSDDGSGSGSSGGSGRRGPSEPPRRTRSCW